jgi:hypothetical protein
MRLNYDMVVCDLEKVHDQMTAEGLEVGLVGHIGAGTAQMGCFFADSFDCKCIQLPSIIRKGRNAALAKIVNGIYPYFPEVILRTLSHQYRKLYSKGERMLPDFDLGELINVESPEMLLVDDNAFTGKTLELWKQRIEDDANKRIHTFSLTVTGDYRPDYFCIEGWRSFEWRAIGV